ncbi:DUF3822 family protein [Deminuibacter soli]|nr:DUF3822 family protein [Deminuibacter soli]
MVQKTFAIYTQLEGTARLYIEAGMSQLACWIKDLQTGQVQAFELFEFDQDKALINFGEIFRLIKLHSKILESSYAGTTIIWENEECLLVPEKYAYRVSAGDYLDMVYGHAPGAITAQQPALTANAIFRAPRSWKEELDKHFPFAKYTHKFQGIYAGNHATDITDGVRVFFYRGHFFLILYRDSQLQLIRRFAYQTPEDVVYYILNTFEQYDLSPAETDVCISGLIDLRSALYSELYKYLQNLKVEEYNDEGMEDAAFGEYPYHYFLPFLKTVG